MASGHLFTKPEKARQPFPETAHLPVSQVELGVYSHMAERDPLCGEKKIGGCLCQYNLTDE